MRTGFRKILQDCTGVCAVGLLVAYQRPLLMQLTDLCEVAIAEISYAKPF